MRIDSLVDSYFDQKELPSSHEIAGVKNSHGKAVDKEKKLQEADAAAKEFEALFVEMMMKSMRATAKPEDESNAQSIYNSMLDSEYSKGMTDAQSFGIREMVRNWIAENS